MSNLHNAKRMTISKLEIAKDNAMAEFGYSDAQTILGNYYQLLAKISGATTLQQLDEIELTDSVLMHE